MSRLLDVEDLAIAFAGAARRAVDGVSYAVGDGDAVGMVGESGAGKTLSALAAVGLLPFAGRVVGGRVTLAGVHVRTADEATLCSLRGRVVGYLSQETFGALNPLRKVGGQVTEAARLHLGVRGVQAEAKAVELLAEVGLEEPHRIARSYPHELSGGQRQRALLAAALAANPRLLIADEPTSALDTVSQVHLLALLEALRAARRLAVLLISHDLRVVGRVAERVVVLHAGETVEEARADVIFSRPAHPYTRALLAAPAVSATAVSTRRPERGDLPPSAATGCRFLSRCPHAVAACRRARPALASVEEGHLVRCFLHHAHEDADG